MINLLSPDHKQHYSYARRNVVLRKWAIGIAASILGTGLIVGAGLLYMNRSIHSYATQKAETEAQLKTQKLEETQAKLQEVSGNLKLVIQVLSQEVLFSKLTQQIGSVMPKDSVLTGLNINKTTGGIDIEAATLSQAVGTQVQVNLQDPRNKIFDKVDIVTIRCTDNDALYAKKYPCTVQVRAAFAACNQFLFVPPACTTGAKK